MRAGGWAGAVTLASLVHEEDAEAQGMGRSREAAEQEEWELEEDRPRRPCRSAILS